MLKRYKILKAGLIFFALMASMSLGGCALLCVPLIHLINAGDSTKDVSSDFARGHVMGKKYELLQDAYLAQYKFSKKISLVRNLTTSYELQDGRLVEVDPYEMKRTIPKGSQFRVCGVLVETNYGNELCMQHILANLIDTEGSIVKHTNTPEKQVPIYVEDLFTNTNESPNENWTFLPEIEWILEIQQD